MRLLDTTTLRLKEFPASAIPQYVILSHTWGDEEILYADVENGTAYRKRGYRKLVNCCERAKTDGYQWVWIDTCCIDKSSSSEISESINSMFRWYQNSQICYAYLADVKGRSTSGDIVDQFKSSRWFTRGWTLQELVAPEVVEFYNTEWVEIGTKSSLKTAIYEISGIDIRILEGAPPSVCNVAHRLSWASTRRTTRVEDMAYSLLGLFDINMPLLYGEGANAFKRLQEEILKNHKDYTLFAWRDHDGLPFGDGILAPSPVNFCRPENCLTCSGLTAWTYKDLHSRPFSDVNRSRQVDSQLSQGSFMMADSADLPTFMVGRLRINLPISYPTDRQNIDAMYQPDPARTVLAYLGYRNGKNGDLLCLRLGPDWEDIHDFYRRSLVQVPKTHITHFKLNTVILVSWRNMTVRIRDQSQANLRESLKYHFVYGPLPPCLSILYDHFPESPRPRIGNPPPFWRHLFTDIHSKDGVTLHNGTWAVSLFKHGHVGLEDQAECVQVQFGPMGNMPMCAMEITELNNIQALYHDRAAEKIGIGLATDRVKVFGCSGRHMLLASAKRQPTTDLSFPRFAIQIVCEVL